MTPYQIKQLLYEHLDKATMEAQEYAEEETK